MNLFSIMKVLRQSLPSMQYSNSVFKLNIQRTGQIQLRQGCPDNFLYKQSSLTSGSPLLPICLSQAIRAGYTSNVHRLQSVVIEIGRLERNKRNILVGIATELDIQNTCISFNPHIVKFTSVVWEMSIISSQLKKCIGIGSQLSEYLVFSYDGNLLNNHLCPIKTEQVLDTGLHFMMLVISFSKK